MIQQAVAQQLFGRGRRAVAGDVVRGGPGHEVHGAELHRDQVRGVGTTRADRQVGLHLEGVGGFDRALELDRDAGMALLQAAQLRRQPIGGQTIGDGDPDRALHALVGAMDVALDLEHRVFDMAGGIEDAFALRGQGDAVGQAVEQPNA